MLKIRKSLRALRRICDVIVYRFYRDNYPQLVSLTSSGNPRERKFSLFDYLKSKLWVQLSKLGLYGVFYGDSCSGNEYIDRMIANGFVVIENFLDAELFQKVT